MEQFSNRVEQELMQFRSREERVGKLFPSEQTRDSFMLAEKIKYFRYLLTKFKKTRNPDELYLLKRIQIERQQLEKQLYPNRFVHLLSSAFRFLATEKQYAGRLQQDVLVNRTRLLDAVCKAGFSVPSEQIFSNLELGKERFTVAVSNYVNEKQRMEHQLVIVKDSSGEYSFDGFKAALHNEGSPESFKEHYFKNDLRIFSPEQAFHLLAGRALEKDGVWLQFDLNDRDASGNYRIKEFRSDYGFDLKNSIETLPLKDKSIYKVDALFNAMKNGVAPTALFAVKECEHSFSMQANPQFRTVDLYDEHSKKINLSALRGKNIPAKGQGKEVGTDVVKNAKQKKKRDVRIK